MQNYISQIESIGFDHSRTDGEVIGLTTDSDYEIMVGPSYYKENTFTVYSLYFGEDEEEYEIDEEVEGIDELLELLEEIYEELS